MSLHSSATPHYPRVLFYVQHLLGTGHLKRAALLQRAMLESGLDAVLVSGGLAAPEVTAAERIVQLPPIRAQDHTFNQLVDAVGNPVDDGFRADRCRQLLGLYHQFRPDVVVIESFPFGRRQMRFELIPLLDAIRQNKPYCLIACSVRDILQARSAERMSETVDLLHRYFDVILVHGDPDFVRLEESFPRADELRPLLHYTGYVAQTMADTGSDAGAREIVVSCGGGAVGTTLLQTATNAQPLSRHKDLTWRILVGPNVPIETFESLQTRTTETIVIEHNRKDFQVLLRNCAVSVSQAGYNTVMDVLQAGAPPVLVPFEGDGETEQSLRAKKLEQRGLACVVTENELSSKSLAAAVDQAVETARPGPHGLNIDGATACAKMLTQLCRQHKGECGEV